VEEPPGHGAGLVEEPEGLFGAFGVDGAGGDEQLQVAVDLLGGAVGDAPQVGAVTSGSAVALGEVRWDRARCTYELIGDRLERSRHSHGKPERDAGCLDGDAVDGET
jgi:hypothetical protein